MNPCFETRFCQLLLIKLNKLSHCSFKLLMSKATNNEIDLVRYTKPQVIATTLQSQHGQKPFKHGKIVHGYLQRIRS